MEPFPVRGMKSRGVTAALAILLGGLGVHYFYLERPGKGLISLLFCWTFIPAIWGLVFGINVMTMTDDRFHKTFRV
jgi:TM2 domain-containing membrane protein YozV